MPRRLTTSYDFRSPLFTLMMLRHFADAEPLLYFRFFTLPL